MRNLVTTTFFALVFAFALPLLAITPYVCDPGTDTHGCECPANLGAAGLDSCTETAHDNLIEATDAAELSNYVSATEEAGIYFVEIDVESMPANGVLRLGSGAGEWDDLEELEDYFKVLLDDSGFQFTFDSGESGFNFLPKMQINQRGATHRFDDVSEQWAPINTNNLIIDAITNRWGVISIAGQVMTLFPWNGGWCPGSDADSDASGSDGDLTARQCSDTRSIWISLWQNDPLCDTHGDPCIGFTRWASTIHETADSAQFGTTLHCSHDESEILCDLVEGWFTSERKLADEISLTNDYYSNTSYDLTDTDTDADVMELVVADTWHDGVCAEGTSTYNADEVTLQTKDGWYDWTDGPCDF